MAGFLFLFGTFAAFFLIVHIWHNYVAGRKWWS